MVNAANAQPYHRVFPMVFCPCSKTHGEALAISGALKFTVEVPELREQRDRLPRQLRSKELGEPSQGPGW